MKGRVYMTLTASERLKEMRRAFILRSGVCYTDENGEVRFVRFMGVRGFQIAPTVGGYAIVMMCSNFRDVFPWHEEIIATCCDFDEARTMYRLLSDTYDKYQMLEYALWGDEQDLPDNPPAYDPCVVVDVTQCED